MFDIGRVFSQAVGAVQRLFMTGAWEKRNEAAVRDSRTRLALDVSQVRTNGLERTGHFGRKNRRYNSRLP